MILKILNTYFIIDKPYPQIPKPENQGTGAVTKTTWATQPTPPSQPSPPTHNF